MRSPGTCGKGRTLERPQPFICSKDESRVDVWVFFTCVNLQETVAGACCWPAHLPTRLSMGGDDVGPDSHWDLPGKRLVEKALPLLKKLLNVIPESIRHTSSQLKPYMAP